MKHVRAWAGAALAIAFLATACAEGGGESGPGPLESVAPPPTTTVDTMSQEEAARFLTTASFGPTQTDIESLVDMGYSAWFREQFRLPMTAIATTTPRDADYDSTLDGWWRNAVYGKDQLRQRAAFALSQIFVVSAVDGDLNNRGHAMARYMDIMQEEAFGNYADLLTAVTYSPAMGIYLTYLGNQKTDPQTGAVPDENYAREVMQLFTIGLVELNLDGTQRLSPAGEPIETYDNMDITELAKVFTGLWWSGPAVPARSRPDHARRRTAAHGDE